MKFDAHLFWSPAIPHNWCWSRVSENFQVINGFPFEAEYFNSDGLGMPLVRIRDILSDTISTFYEGESGLNCVTQDGDIVIGMDGDFNCGWWSKGTALLNQRVGVLRAMPYGKVYPRFAFYQIPYGLKVINELTAANTVKHLSSFDIAALRLPIPDFPTQKIITTFLDQETARIDALIEKNERLISLCEEKRRSEMKEVFSQASNRGMTKFKRMFDITLGKMLQPEAQSTADVKLPYLRAANVLSGRVSHEDINTMWFSEREAQKFRVSSGDLLVLEGGDVGRSAIASKFENGLGFQNSIHRVRATRRGDVLCAHFWLQHLKAEGYFEQICSKATLAHFTLDKFRETPFPFMEQEEQARVGNLLLKKTTAIDSLVKKTKKFIELLKEKRSALITAAVTGQIDIPE